MLSSRCGPPMFPIASSSDICTMRCLGCQAPFEVLSRSRSGMPRAEIVDPGATWRPAFWATPISSPYEPAPMTDRAGAADSGGRVGGSVHPLARGATWMEAFTSWSGGKCEVGPPLYTSEPSRCPLDSDVVRDCQNASAFNRSHR